MAKKKFTACMAVLFASIILLVALLPVYFAVPKGDYKVYTTYEVTVNEGHTIFNPSQSWGYCYGPTFVMGENGHVDGLFSCPGSLGTVASSWDTLVLKTSEDYGKTWTDGKVCIQSTPGGYNKYSTCDPGMVYFNGYYYVGYTTTLDHKSNVVCIKRAQSLDGPWEDWNGSGWAQDNGSWAVNWYGTMEYYGIGEPSLVVVDDKIYVYYTYQGNLSNGLFTDCTRVAVGDATDPNWPATLKEAGRAVDRVFGTQDSLDVKYIPSLKKFLAVNVLNVRSTIAEFCFYMSDNGINFYKIGSVNASGLTAMHNAGMAGNGYGHIDLEQPVIMGYAYQESNGTWGQWPTAISYLTIRQVEKIVEKDFTETYAKDPVWETEPAAFAFTTLHDTNENVPLSGCAPENVLDENPNSKYYSATMEYEFQGQAIAIGTPGSFSQITVQPVGSMVHFPVDFRFQYSDDGIIFYDIEGASYTNYSISSSEPITFKFGKKVTAKYVRLLATKLSKDSFGTYALEIAEMSVK